MVDYRNLRTVKQIAAQNPAITEDKLRWWIFNADSNGIDQAIVKVSGRLFIDVEALNRWLNEQRLA